MIMVTSRKPQEMYGVVAASKVVGETVVDRQGDKLGKIHELMIDANAGRLAYAVLAADGKYFAMPWQAFEFSNTENKLILNVDKKKLEAAPGFDKNDKWPDFSDKSWGDGIYKYYDQKPYWNV
jgi:sporulation protein YlmC with PRC-barrel domain